jgi:cation transport ATPase
MTNEQSNLPNESGARNQINTTTQPLPPQQLIEQFLTNQAEELRLRAKEIEAEKQKDQNGYQYASKSLELQAEDRKNGRHWTHQNRKLVAITVVLCVLLIVALVVAAMFLNKDQIALEIIKAIVYIGVGVIGGYGFGYAKDTSGDSASPQNSRRASGRPPRSRE